MPEAASTRPRIALVLGGGNALGAYHAGLYQALSEAALEPDWVVGTSIGAVTGAVIAGNRPQDRLDRLQRLWRPQDKSDAWPMPWDMIPETWRRTGAVIETMIAGRDGLFGPLGSGDMRWGQDPRAGSPALYGSRMLSDTLGAMVDFDLLNSGSVRFTAAAVDIETGEEVWIDTSRQLVTADHVRASAALLSTFPAVEVDGRVMGDGGLAVNLPLDPVLGSREPGSILCIASDLLPLSSRRPRGLGEVVGRTQDLMFAAQTHRTLERWKAVFAAAPSDRERPAITLMTLAYTDQDREVAGKAMDFSARTIRERWDAGHRDGMRAMELYHGGGVAIGRPGLTIVPCGASYQP